jgi:hypothetical protein
MFFDWHNVVQTSFSGQSEESNKGHSFYQETYQMRTTWKSEQIS